MRLLYLDYNCFQRSFDDQRQSRIRREAEACERIFAESAGGQVELVWSFMHEDENEFCPFPVRRVEITRLAQVCAKRVNPVESIRIRAHELQRVGRLSAKDALHVACALHSRAGWFLTCDDQLIKRASRLNLGLQVSNPVVYVAIQSIQP